MTRPLGVIFDLDGTVYLGDQLIPGASETVERMRELQHPLVFVTNAIETIDDHVNKLGRLGIPVSPNEIITAAVVFVDYLRKTMPNACVFPLADLALIDQLAPYFRFSENPNEIDVVVVSTDQSFDHRQLTIAFQAIRRGARFMATNADPTWPQDGGEIPDAGAIIAALEACTMQKVEVVTGKPSSFVTELVLTRLDRRADECIIVGDSLASDMTMGKRAGMKTVLVLTGVTHREQLIDASVQPDFVLASIADVPGLLATLIQV